MTPAAGGFDEQVAAAGGLLKGRGWTVATAESCTGGWVGMALTALPGASDYYVGGVVAYADPVKVAILGVDPDDLTRHGAVSEIVARQMAGGAADRFDADAALAVTGIAGPAGGSEDKPVGTVWMAVHTPKISIAEMRRFSGGRQEVRRATVGQVLGMLIRAVE